MMDVESCEFYGTVGINEVIYREVMRATEWHACNGLSLTVFKDIQKLNTHLLGADNRPKAFKSG